MSPDFRTKGRAALEAAMAPREKPRSNRWAPMIRWTEDSQKRFVLVLTPGDDITQVSLHEWIKVGMKDTPVGPRPRWESFLSRKDPLIGEAYDDLENRLGIAPKTRFVGVLAELEPIMQTKGTRQRPASFTISTRSYVNKSTEEEITVPRVGLAVQSASLFWKPLSDLDEDSGPLVELPLSITRSGMGTDTHYNIFPYIDVPVDLSPLVEYGGNISYLADLDDPISDSDPQQYATQISDRMIRAYLTELMDKNRYESLVGPLQSVEGYSRTTPTTTENDKKSNKEGPASQQFEELRAKLHARGAA